MKNCIPEQLNNELEQKLEVEWSELCAHFLSAQEQKPSERLKFFGELFEQLQPWLEESIDDVSSDNYLLLSTEALVSYLFILLLNRDQLPPANCVFNLWIESLALSRANEIIKYGAQLQGCPGEAPLEIQQRFNKLTKRQRAIFYLYIIERGQLKEVSRAIGITPREIHGKIPSLLEAVGVDENIAPYGWRRINDR
ncbi:MAG: hypothetical protein H8E25_00325 [Planctomycetes bacterium]|nr:hypothetical protein [Planctomycetota bacterium]